MKTVVSVIGTRPEATKMLPVLQELRRHQDVRSVLVSTGQHREMLRQTFTALGLTPDHNLDLMQPDQTLAQLTANLLTSLDPLLGNLQPDWVIAQGDTTTVMVTAMLAFYRRLRFGHVEAGLRTYDFEAPFPEEYNRRVADLAAAAYFAPTEHAAEALRREGIAEPLIHITGNTGVDAALMLSQQPFDWSASALATVDPDQPFVLITAHRRENFGEPLLRICEAITRLARRFTHVQFVYTVHLNPNVQRTVYTRLGQLANVHLLPPLDYPTMVHAIRHAYIILTDSGGIQEEAPSFGVPLLVLREVTERPEGVAVGCAELVGTDVDLIVQRASSYLMGSTRPRHQIPNPYGDGQAAARIVDILLRS
ncbi:MAG: UDP-N-acetylglucosamine 2-epimerase (non-hydrolyzing) [Aggregatilineales bacterium]